MAKVKALELLFDGITLRQPDEEFDFDGAPAPHIEFLDAKDEKKAADKHRADKVAAKQAEVEAQVRAELEVKLRAEAEEKLRAEVEEKVRAETKAKLKKAGENAAADLV
jgi:hypothetical protein